MKKKGSTKKQKTPAGGADAKHRQQMPNRRSEAEEGQITYSVETLYHFSCQCCEKWWSISNFEFRRIITCPYCGSRSSIKMKTEGKLL